MSYFNKVQIYGADTASIDAFARLRVSDPTTLFDSKQIYDTQPLFWDDQEVSGGSTTTSHSVNTASTTIGVALNTAGVRTRQTFMRFNYQPGKSQLLFLTGVMDKTGGGTGITRYIGFGDDDNGLFFKDDEGTLKVVRRTKVTGSPVDNEVAQSAWNIDKLDGTGASGITLDISKANIFVIDFEWLGTGRVRFGFVIDGLVYYCHEFLNANSLTEVYMSTPNLPVRYSIENDGTGAASTLEQICSTVISEGGEEKNGAFHYESTAGTHVSTVSENIIYALIGIRLRSTHLGLSVTPHAVDLFLATASSEVEWILAFNPTVAGSFTYSAKTNSGCEVAKGGSTNTVTFGSTCVPIHGGFVTSGSPASGGSGSTGETFNSALRLGSAIDGTQDEIVLCARPINGSTAVDIEAGISWRELI